MPKRTGKTSGGFPDEVLILNSLSSTRRKRAVPEDWATSDGIATYAPKATVQTKHTGGTALAVHQGGDLVVVGGAGGAVDIFSVAKEQVIESFQVGSGDVTAAVWAGDRAVISTSTGQVTVRDPSSGNELGSFSSHTGAISGLSTNATDDLVASVGVDGTYTIYDLEQMSVATQVPSQNGMSFCFGRILLLTSSAYTTVEFHPDGHLLAAGDKSGNITVYEVASGSIGATFEFGAPVKCFKFSENGTWFAIVAEDSSKISIWDIRKQNEIANIDAGGMVDTIDWDYTGQFLVGAGPGGTTVNQYSKANKSWTQPLLIASPAKSIAWGKSARALVGVDGEGTVTVLA
jgi:pre-mRNA-processing factor 19